MSPNSHRTAFLTSASATSTSTSAAQSTPASRLNQLSGHMSATHAPPAFGPSIVPQAPEDPLFGLMAAFRRDTFDKKVDLGVGAYRDENAKPWVLPVVKKADELVRADPELNHEYLPIAGLPSFSTGSQKLIFGADSAAIKEGRVTSVQAISGTGALHLGALFLSKFYRPDPSTTSPPAIYLSTPTWANHHQIFSNVGLPLASYPYWDASTRGLDESGMLEALISAPTGSIVLLHACAHNPTGVDPTAEQWSRIADACAARGLLPFFDCAYQGFASGDTARDAAALRAFAARGFPLLVAQSYAKNLGLYGQRAGCFHFVAGTAEPDAPGTVARVASQLAILQRSEISNPPAFGARIAARILEEPQLTQMWDADLQTMAGRIADMRRALRDRLEQLGTPGTWTHVTDQIGMFSFTGLSPEQVQKMRDEHHVYMTKNGRISIAGLNPGNVDYVGKAIDKVVRETQ